MSILVQDPIDGFYKLYVKGADSEIKKRMKKVLDRDSIEAKEQKNDID
jgi:magnesium-transporting ATPase (P-type)